MKYTQSNTYPDRSVQVSFSEDGTSVYFGNLFPGFLNNSMGAWIKGDIQPDSTIIVRMQHFMDYDVAGDESLYYELYAGSIDLATNTPGDAILVLKEGGVITQKDPNSYLWVGAYSGETYLGLITYETQMELKPVIDLPELVTVPETAEVSEAIYEYSDAYKASKTVKGQIATDGNDVYFLGLVPEAGTWVKGTREGNTVTLKEGQYLGDANGYFLKLGFLTARSDFSAYEEVDQITFTYDPETETYCQLRESDTDDYLMIVEKTLSGTIFLYNFDFTVHKYDGPRATIPSDPMNLVFYDFWESQQKYALMFDNTLFGKDGTYLEPENLYFYAYLDDEILTFSPDTYTTLSEEMTLIPWNFTLSNNDIYGSPTRHYFYIYDPLFEKVGAQFVYMFDDQPYYSNIVYIDPEGNVTTVEVENTPVGISLLDDSAVVDQRYYDVTGRSQQFQRKGFNIVSVTRADGSKRVYKMLVK